MHVNKTFKIVTILWASMLVFSVNASSVFKVEKDGKRLYLGGTFHILTAQDYPLPEAYEKAYEEADKLVFETDIAAMNSPEFQQKSINIIMQKPGITLNSQLNAENQENLQKYVESRGIPAAQIQVLTPAGAMLVLTISEYQIRGFTQEGVDQHYATKAEEAGKGIAHLESVDSQLALIASFNDVDPNTLIAYTLEEMGRSDEMIDSLHTAWKSGDMDTLAKVGFDSWEDEYPTMYEDVMVKRNNAWYPQITAMMQDDEVEYVLVGALHLAGKDGLIKLLEDDGYSVTQVK